MSSNNSQNLRPILERTNPDASAVRTKFLALITPQDDNEPYNQDSIFETFGNEGSDLQLLPLGYYGETTSLMPTQAICSSTRSSSQT